MSEALRDKWTWIVMISMILVLLGPLIVVWLVLQLSPELRLVATIVIIVVWGVVSGYKDWIISKRKEEENVSG